MKAQSINTQPRIKPILLTPDEARDEQATELTKGG